MKTSYEISVIILTLNQKDKTLRCLKSLSQIEYSHYKIFLLDNGSDDMTIDAVKQEFPEVIAYYSVENLGVAGGRNFAAKKITETHSPDYFLFLDNDTTVEKDFLYNLADAIEKNENAAIATPKIKLFNNTDIIYGAGGVHIKFWLGKTKHKGYKQSDRGQFDKNMDCISSGGCMLVDSKLFFELKGFDENYGHYGPEDIDFVLRARKKNYRCIYVFNSVIYHDPEPGRTYYKGNYTYEYAKNKLKQLKMLNKKHAPGFEKFVFLFAISPLLYFKSLIDYIFTFNRKV